MPQHYHGTYQGTLRWCIAGNTAPLAAQGRGGSGAGQQGSNKQRAKKDGNKRGVKREREQQARHYDEHQEDDTDTPHSATGEVVNLCDEVGHYIHSRQACYRSCTPADAVVNGKPQRVL